MESLPINSSSADSDDGWVVVGRKGRPVNRDYGSSLESSENTNKVTKLTPVPNPVAGKVTAAAIVTAGFAGRIGGSGIGGPLSSVILAAAHAPLLSEKSPAVIHGGVGRQTSEFVLSKGSSLSTTDPDSKPPESATLSEVVFSPSKDSSLVARVAGAAEGVTGPDKLGVRAVGAGRIPLEVLRLFSPRGFVQIGKRVIGLARPGFTAHSEAIKPKIPDVLPLISVAERCEIETTLRYLIKEKKVVKLISLATASYHTSHDPLIQSIASRILGCDMPLEWIHNEDNVPYKHSFKKGSGPSLRKIHRFNEIARSCEGVFATYCGAGQGRTTVYLAAYLISQNPGMRAEDAVEYVLRGFKGETKAKVWSQVEGNWGYYYLLRLTGEES